jgi:[ribosomal protein S5]-alanine N-acetyltransferase
MAAELSPFIARGRVVGLRRPTASDREEFVKLARGSVEFLRPWIDPPATDERFDEYLRRRRGAADDGVLVCEIESGRIAGVINVSCIVRGLFQSAYLGYWIGEPFAKRGYMTEGMGLLVGFAFGEMKLHRLEANIQPGNLASIALVRRCGFKKEGFSPKYLRVFGEWRDHERWAVRAEED